MRLFNIVTLAALPLLLLVTSEVRGSDDLEDLSFDSDEEPNSTEPGKSPSSSAEKAALPQLPTTEEDKKEFVKRVMTAVMARPGARSRLGQVLPILRQMSAPQRLALASLVMSQVLADPSEPMPELPRSSENATAQLMLPISMDIANMFRGVAREQQPSGRSSNGYYPNEVYGGRLRPPAALNGRRPHPSQSGSGINRRNANVHIDKLPSRPRPGRPPLRKPVGVKHTCSKVTNTVCVDSNDYPEEAIVEAINSDSHPERFKLFMTEPPMDGELEPELQRRKSDQPDSQKGHMCSSRVELARPKKARATSGQWKFIVNTKDYTQTLRLEICSRPQSRCNYLPEGVDSQCVQVYNYHRLLTWDETAGLTMDVFKVPTCCSCRVMGYNGVPFPVPSKTSSAPELDSNLVSSDDSANSVRVPQVPPAPHKPIRGSYNSPKRESVGSGGDRRWPTVQHRGPPLPLEGEGSQDEQPRYPPLDNTLRRTTRNNTVDRIRFKPSPNTRHPALPMDSMNSETMPVSSPPYATRPSQQPPRRINYSYHPIIDYFRPHSGEEMQRAESRIGHDWTPITASDVPR